MTVWWAKPTLDDIAAQRAMIERGEEKRKADWKQAERERLRDTFAAAALTGWLASQQTVISRKEMAMRAYDYADAMLRERGNHSEKPNSSLAPTDSERTPQTHATPGEGSVQDRCTLTEEEREAIEVAAAAYADDHGERFAAILRNLLARLHT